MKKLLLLLSFAVLVIGFQCDDDSPVTDTYDVTVEILHPDDGATVNVNEALDVHVKLTRPNDGKIHNVLIQIKDEAGAVVVETLEDKHLHVNGETEVEKSWTPTVAGNYKVYAESTDDANENPVSETHTITAQ